MVISPGEWCLWSLFGKYRKIQTKKRFDNVGIPTSVSINIFKAYAKEIAEAFKALL